jgi:hypothetical protein
MRAAPAAQPAKSISEERQDQRGSQWVFPDGFVARISSDADFAAEADEFQAARMQTGRPSSSMRLSALTAILTSHRRRESSLERKASPITRL